MSNQDGGYGSGMAPNDRVARRGPSHQTSHKSHVGQDAQGTSHSLLRTPLFGSAVPRRQRTASVKRPSTSWHDAARQLRQRQAAAVNNNPGRIINRPSPTPVDIQVDTEQEHEVAEALFDLANMFARPSPPEPQRKPSHFGSHPSAARSYSKMHRVRGDQEQYRDQGSLKRQISLPDREGKRVQTRDWHVKPELPSHSTSQHNEAALADAGPSGTVSTPRAVKAAQHVAAPGPTSLGSTAPVSLGLGAFHPGVPPGLPAYFRNGAQGQSVTNSDGHSGQWGSTGQGQSAGHIAHAREVPDSGMSGAFSKPTEGNPAPRPKSLRRSANHVYIAHMIVEWQHQLSRLRHQKSYQQSAANLPYSASLPYTEPGLARSQSGSGPSAAPRQSSPSAAVKQEQAASLSQQSAPPPAAVPPSATSTFQFAPPFSLAAMRPPTSQHPPGPRDSSGNIIPPAQYYKNMLGPQKFEALQPRLPLLQPGATWPMGPPGGPSPFVSAPPMLNPQQAAAFAAQMSMFAAAPHSFPGLPGFPSGPLQAQLASSQPGQAGFLRGVRWPDTKEASTLQELPSSASPVVSDAKHAPSKLVKQEDSKGDSPAPAVPGISAEGLERLIAMGRPQGFLDSHNLAQFGVPEHVLQAINKPHSQQNQDGRAMH